jgi:hypothetical protein
MIVCPRDLGPGTCSVTTSKFRFQFNASMMSVRWLSPVVISPMLHSKYRYLRWRHPCRGAFFASLPLCTIGKQISSARPCPFMLSWQPYRQWLHVACPYTNLCSSSKRALPKLGSCGSSSACTLLLRLSLFPLHGPAPTTTKVHYPQCKYQSLYASFSSIT